jgi:hypothetical protein
VDGGVHRRQRESRHGDRRRHGSTSHPSALAAPFSLPYGLTVIVFATDHPVAALLLVFLYRARNE